MEGQNARTPMVPLAVLGPSGERKGEKMLSPTLPRPGAVPPGSGDTHQLQHPPAGTACTDQPLAHLAAFLPGNGSPQRQNLEPEPQRKPLNL